MTEPDVTLSDFALALLCGWFVFNLGRQASNSHRNIWMVLFASLSLASLAGGLVHGFFLDPSVSHEILWATSLLSIGITAACTWVLAGNTLFGAKGIIPSLIFSIVTFAIYGIVVIFVSQKFIVAIIGYLPASIAFLLASVFAYLKRHNKHYLWIIAGLLTTFVAAGIQSAKIAIHPVYFNHNSFYHLVQAMGLILLFLGAKRILKTEGP